MKITILNVGKVRQTFIKEGEAEYAKRLRSTPCAVQFVELGLEPSESMSVAEVQEREAKELEKRLGSYDFVVALDERGAEISSKEFAQMLDTRMQSACKSLVFVIGGAYGFAERIRQRADYVLSLSRLTFPHQVTRLVLVEQIYRAHTLMRGIAYHK